MTSVLSNLEARSYEFENYRLVPSERLLLRDGRPVSLPPKIFETLVALVESGGHLVEKDALMTRLWPDTFVEEATLSRNISDLRKTLGESGHKHIFIETVPKCGYRFLAVVRHFPAAEATIETDNRVPESVIKDDKPRQEHLQLVESQLNIAIKANRPLWLTKKTLLAMTAFAGLSIALIVALGWRSVLRPSKETRATSSVRSIAVLPFKPLSADGSDEYLGLGMADTLITKLSNLRQIIVRPTGAVRKYMTPDQDPVAAGREQRVDAVLDGSIQKSGDKVRLTVRLVRVADGVTLWASQFDQKFTDIFVMQDAISERVVGTLALNLTNDDRKLLTKRHTENTEAYQHYLKGRYFLNKRTREGISKAFEYFEQAVALDPNDALAYLGLGDCYHQSVYFTSVPSRELIAKAKAMARKALELDGSLGEAHALLSILNDADWDWNEALKEYQLAISLGPVSARAYHGFAFTVAKRGRFDEAVAAIKKAEEMDPTNLVISSDVAAILCYAGRFDEAIEQSRKTLELDPNFSMAHAQLGVAYWGKGIYKEALGPLQRAVELEGEGSIRMIQLAMGYGFAGQKEKTQEFLRRLKKRSESEYVDPTWFAGLYAAIGDKRKALDWIEKACDERSIGATALLVDHRFNTLRSEPRYQAVLSRMGFAS